MTESEGVVRGLAIRSGERAPMTELYACRASVGKGLEGDDRAQGKRGVTLLSAECWVDAIAEVGTVLPWYARRANLLVEDMDLSALIGKRIQIGGVDLRIWGETRPCGLMDEICPGLRDALKPAMRGGVHGEVLREGEIRVGDVVKVAPE